MLHPVGPHSVAVYWRRRLLVLALLVAVLGGGTWVLVAALSGPGGDAAAATGPSEAASTASAEPPALERVVPSLTAVQTPTPPATVAPRPADPPTPPPPTPGGPCTDDMIAVEVRTPGSAAAGDRSTFELVVSNVSPVPCVRVLDKGLQEIVLLDTAGTRMWGSNDCFPEAGADTRTLAPGEAVGFPLVWGGLSSEPTCSGDRNPLAPGSYLLRGRLDTKISPEAPFSIS